MTPSDRDGKTCRLGIQAWNEYTNHPDEDTQLTVFDGHGTRMGEGLGRLSLRLSRGIYTIRAERFGEVGNDVVILHEKSQEIAVPAPRRHSAMPSTDTRHTHEFLQASAHRYSRSTTWNNPRATDRDPLLMILARATGDDQHSGTDPTLDLALIDADGAVVTRFEDDRIEGCASEGWKAFSAKMPPGDYLLCELRDGRAISLPILLTRKRWDTLVFVPVEGRPRLSAASIDMCRRGEGYNANERFTQTIDAAVLGLGMRLDLLPCELRNDAIYGKFSHPFHGLIGAYAHFLGPRRAERLEQQVLSNLWRLLEGAPDVIALLLLAHEREKGQFPDSLDQLNALAEEAFGTTLEDRLPLAFPPLLRSSLDVLVRAGFGLPDLIKPDSWLDTAATSDYADGPWAVWDQESAAVVPGVVAKAAAKPPTPQRLYPVLKRAIALETNRDARSIVADDRLDELMDNQAARLPGILSTVASEMPEYTVSPNAGTRLRRNRVRDLLRQVQVEAVPEAPEAAVLKPDTSLPGWLVTLVHDRLKSEGADFDPRAVARMANVPLFRVQRAMDLDDPS